MPCTAEKPVTTETLVTEKPRPTKEVLLPQIAALALAGQTCRQIAETFGLTKSTVNRWLQEIREDCPTRFAGCAEIVAAAVAGYWSLHDEALEGFRLSQADKVSQRVVETTTARGLKKTRTVRTENQAGKPTFLTQARQAPDGIARIAAKVAPRAGGMKQGEVPGARRFCPRAEGKARREQGSVERTFLSHRRQGKTGEKRSVRSAFLSHRRKAKTKGRRGERGKGSAFLSHRRKGEMRKEREKRSVMSTFLSHRRKETMRGEREKGSVGARFCPIAAERAGLAGSAADKRFVPS